jgi:hypothetical protein
MSKTFDAPTEEQIAFIGAQHLCFVGTAARDGRVNASPKGMDSLRVLGAGRSLWLNLTGSGNETTAHLADSPRMTLIWCSFTTRPLIPRACGTARAVHHGDPDWATLAPHLPAKPGARQIDDLTIDLVLTSCGYAVPFMDFREDRTVLRIWAEDKGPDGLRACWKQCNGTSLDGKPTGIDAHLGDPA